MTTQFAYAIIGFGVATAIGAVALALVLAYRHVRRDAEQRARLEEQLKAAQEKLDAASRQGTTAWTYDQLERIENVQAMLARHLKEREIADEYLKSVYAMLGQFNKRGPNGNGKHRKE